MIPTDLECARCGYNVRGLPGDGCCPECRLDVSRSASPVAGRFVSRRHALRFRRGLCLLVVAVLLDVGAALLHWACCRYALQLPRAWFMALLAYQRYLAAAAPLLFIPSFAYICGYTARETLGFRSRWGLVGFVLAIIGVTANGILVSRRSNISILVDDDMLFGVFVVLHACRPLHWASWALVARHVAECISADSRVARASLMWSAIVAITVLCGALVIRSTCEMGTVVSLRVGAGLLGPGSYSDVEMVADLACSWTTWWDQHLGGVGRVMLLVIIWMLIRRLNVAALGIASDPQPPQGAVDDRG